MTNSIWLPEHHDFAVCKYCHSQMFGKAYRKWKEPKIVGNNIVYEKTEIKICGTCHKNLIKVEHEKRNYTHFKRRAFEAIRIRLSHWKKSRPGRNCKPVVSL